MGQQLVPSSSATLSNVSKGKFTFIVSPIKLQRKGTFEKLVACKWSVFC